MTEQTNEGEEGEIFVVEHAERHDLGQMKAKALLLCDHASCRLPHGMTGVPAGVLRDHDGWDIGALGVARVIARELSLSLVWSDVSRLVIDPNRGLRSLGLIREDLGIAMNAKLDTAERQRRIAMYYEPYHCAINGLLDKEDSIEGVIAIHTFTPMWEGERRKWEAGLIYDVAREKDRTCASFIKSFLENEGFCVGDNEPYPPLEGDSLAQHGEARGIVGVGIEIRNDLLRVEHTQKEWGMRLAKGIAGWMQELNKS